MRIGSTVGPQLGQVSFDDVRPPDGVHEELCIINGKQDERVRGTLIPRGCVRMSVRDGGDGDGAMRKIQQWLYEGTWISALLGVGGDAPGG